MNIGYRISRERLSGIADQARRLGDTQTPLTPAQIQAILEGVKEGSAPDDMLRHIITQAETFTSRAEMVGVEDRPEYYYGGVLFPRIPEEVAAMYPYTIIRDDTENNGQYDLILSTAPFTYNSTSTRLTVNSSALPRQMYYVLAEDVGTALTWTFSKSTTADIGLAPPRTIIWSNFNIANLIDWSFPVVPGEEG